VRVDTLLYRSGPFFIVIDDVLSRASLYSTLQDGGDVFTREGMPRIPFPNGWKGRNGLYTVGFSQRGLLGTSSDALNVARDIHCQFRDTGRLTDNVLLESNSSV
jgi:indole-3-pyruvate monooxygenase